MKKTIIAIFNILVSLILSFFFLFPLIWLVSSAFKKREDIFNYPPEIIPANPTYRNFIDIFQQAPFFQYMLNSLFVAISITILALFFHSIAAYALARLKFPGRDVIFVALIATMMIPFSVRMVPLFIITKRLGWIDTFAGLIIPSIFSAFGIFFLRQFYLTIPVELEEAAIIDGCSRFGVWYHIFLPLSKSIMIILGVLFFIANYNDFIWPLIITNSDNMRVIQVGLVYFTSARGSHWNLILAGAAIAALPTILIFIFMQQYLVEGIKMSGIKG